MRHESQVIFRKKIAGEKSTLAWTSRNPKFKTQNPKTALNFELWILNFLPT
jgi:hypothetical protein